LAAHQSNELDLSALIEGVDSLDGINGDSSAYRGCQESALFFAATFHSFSLGKNIR
jgi:hypothetical protein